MKAQRLVALSAVGLSSAVEAKSSLEWLVKIDPRNITNNDLTP